MMFDFIAIQEGCYGTFWGPCFCPDDSRTCAACQNAKRLDELGLDWEEWYEKARVDDWKHIDELTAIKDKESSLPCMVGYFIGGNDNDCSKR